MTPLELQALIGHMLPSDINCAVEWDGLEGRLMISNWCSTVEACGLWNTMLDQTEDMLQRTLKPFLQQAMKELRSSQTKNHAGMH